MLAVASEPVSTEPRKPSRDEKEYQKLLEDYLGPATGFLIMLACMVMKIPNAEAVADHLAMNEAEQELVIEPLAKLLDKQHFDSKVKTAIVSSGDAIGLVLGLGAYGMRVLGALQQLKGIGYGTSGNTPQQAQAPAGAGANGNGHGPQFAGGLAAFGQYSPG